MSEQYPALIDAIRLAADIRPEGLKSLEEALDAGKVGHSGQTCPLARLTDQSIYNGETFAEVLLGADKTLGPTKFRWAKKAGNRFISWWDGSRNPTRSKIALRRLLRQVQRERKVA